MYLVSLEKKLMQMIDLTRGNLIKIYKNKNKFLLKFK